MDENFGLWNGLAVRNVGYIISDYTDPSDNLSYKKKFRSYNLGIPLGIKIGNLDRIFFYGGYEIELAMAYKEKTYENGDRINKITGWFSNRQELFQHGFLAGIQFPYGANLKFKYYLDNSITVNIQPMPVYNLIADLNLTSIIFLCVFFFQKFRYLYTRLKRKVKLTQWLFQIR